MTPPLSGTVQARMRATRITGQTWVNWLIRVNPYAGARRVTN